MKYWGIIMFKFLLDTYHYTCGDGCCTDTTVDLSVNDKVLYFYRGDTPETLMDDVDIYIPLDAEYSDSNDILWSLHKTFGIATAEFRVISLLNAGEEWVYKLFRGENEINESDDSYRLEELIKIIFPLLNLEFEFEYTVRESSSPYNMDDSDYGYEEEEQP